MAMTARKLRSWLERLEPGELVGINGDCLETAGGAEYLEVGEAIAEAAAEPEDDYSGRWVPETKTAPKCA
jgi:hypothetical protein